MQDASELCRLDSDNSGVGCLLLCETFDFILGIADRYGSSVGLLALKLGRYLSSAS